MSKARGAGLSRWMAVALVGACVATVSASAARADAEPPPLSGAKAAPLRHDTSRAPNAVSADGAAARSTAAATAVAAGYQCWNHFVPPNPDGGPVTQQYKNCNGYDLWVMPVYYYGFEIYTYFASCTFVPNNGEVGWYFPATVSGANYTIVVCDPYNPHLFGLSYMHYILAPW